MHQDWPTAQTTLAIAVANTLDAAGIEIPFPQRTVWVRTAEPDAAPG